MKIDLKNQFLNDQQNIMAKVKGELDENKLRDFTKRVVASSNIHETCEFKDLTCQIKDSIIGRNC